MEKLRAKRKDLPSDYSEKDVFLAADCWDLENFIKQGLSRVIKNTKLFEVILEHLILHPGDSVFRLSANPVHD